MRIVLFCFVLSSSAVLAQQKPHYTQYLFNQYILNPAITGIENYTDVRMSHRLQWVGIQDAPVTTYLTIHTPIGKKDFRTTATSYAMPGENPRGKSYWEQYTAAQPHHGAGLQLINDRTGPLSRFSAMATYAYHLGISPKTSLAAGFGAGISSVSLNTSKLVLDDPNDPSLLASIAKYTRLKPDFTAGVYLYSANYFVGLSAQQLIPQPLYFQENSLRTVAGRAVPHVFALAGYRLLLNEDFNCIPSVLVKFVNPLPIQWEVNTRLQYRDLCWIGGSYRQEEGFAGMLGFRIASNINFGYSYDYSTSALGTFSRGTHELLLGFILGNQYPDTCPKNVW